MLERLANFSIRRRRAVMAAALLLLVLATTFGSGVFSRLDNGGFVNDDAESSQATAKLADELGISQPNFTLLVDGAGASVDDPAVAEIGQETTRRLAENPDVVDVVSYWTTPNSASLKNEAGTAALIVGRIDVDDADLTARASELSREFERDGPGVTIEPGGGAVVFEAINTQVREDLAKAEAIAIPIVLVLLVFVFGGLVAASLPLLVGLFSIIGTFLVLRLFTEFTDVSVFSINLVTMLGLGLGIDYSLFVVSRYREELAKGLDRNAAIVTSVKTAGRTVLFSALAIGVSLMVLLVFPLGFLRSFAYAGVSVVVIAAVASIVLLPSVLAALGPRIDKWTVIKRRQDNAEQGFWARVARVVMRRPVVIATTTIAVLLVVGTPFLDVRWGPTDDRVLPPGSETYQVQERIRTEFAGNSADDLTVVGATSATSEADRAEFAMTLSGLDDVASVASPYGTYVDGDLVAVADERASMLESESTVAYSLRPAEGVSTVAVENIVKEVRSMQAPFEVMVTGLAAVQVDTVEPIADSLVLAGLLIAVAMFVILFLMTGSVVIPVKAIILGALSLTATFGAMVWIFQEGNLSGFFAFNEVGYLDPTNPIVMFVIAFGLSMDYEVFLLSRIKEHHDLTGDTNESVAVGLAKTGRLLTAAALLIAVVFAAFAASGITFIKLIGLGLAVAVLVDATVIRGVLVPASMRILGGVNWWAPAPMKKLHSRIGLSEQ